MPHSTSHPNIYIVGAQCTGKTTIINELKHKFHALTPTLLIDEPHIVSEVARSVLKQHPIETESIRSDPQQSLDLQRRILAAQADAEETALSRASWLISDRSGLDPLAYARRYAGADAADAMMRSDTWTKLKRRMSRSVVIVCEAGAEWLRDDGVRLMPKDSEDWMSLHELFCEMLDEAGLPYHVLPATMTDTSQRVDFVLSKWSRVAESQIQSKLTQLVLGLQ